eukprot:1295762-Prymnesium_polylepis.4
MGALGRRLNQQLGEFNQTLGTDGEPPPPAAGAPAESTSDGGGSIKDAAKETLDGLQSGRSAAHDLQARDHAPT